MNEQIAAALQSVDSSAVIWLMVCMAVLPVAFLIGAFVLYMKKYKIDEKYYEEICAEIKKRDGIEDGTPCDCEGECTCGCCDDDCCTCPDGEECDCGCHEGEACNCGCEEHNHEEAKCTCGCCAEHTPDAETPATEDAE